MFKELASKASGVTMHNWSLGADSQLKVAVARRVLPAGHLHVRLHE